MPTLSSLVSLVMTTTGAAYDDKVASLLLSDLDHIGLNEISVYRLQLYKFVQRLKDYYTANVVLA